MKSLSALAEFMTVERANAPKIYSDFTTWVSREQIEPRFFEHVTTHSLNVVKKSIKIYFKVYWKSISLIAYVWVLPSHQAIKKGIVFEHCTETEKGPCAL